MPKNFINKVSIIIILYFQLFFFKIFFLIILIFFTITLLFPNKYATKIESFKIFINLNIKKNIYK